MCLFVAFSRIPGIPLSSILRSLYYSFDPILPCIILHSSPPRCLSLFQSPYLSLYCNSCFLWGRLLLLHFCFCLSFFFFLPEVSFSNLPIISLLHLDVFKNNIYLKHLLRYLLPIFFNPKKHKLIIFEFLEEMEGTVLGVEVI
jgi:hypothetical protein